MSGGNQGKRSDSWRADRVCAKQASFKLVTGVCATRRSLQPTGMAASGRAAVTRRSSDLEASRDSKISTHVGERAALVHIEGRKGGTVRLKQVTEPQELTREFFQFSKAETAQRGEADRSRSRSSRRRSLDASSSTVNMSKSKAQPIHVTLADRAALCQLIGTRSTQRRTSRSADSSGADERRRMAKRSST